jgi:hypothetical protein
LGPVLEQVGQQLEEGQFDPANQRLLAFFPPSGRTTAQTLALANTLYGVDAKLSYRLHKQAAQELPQEPLVLLEWAMEQHRAGEYAGALEVYNAYSKAHPQFAPVHGLAADCLIRLGRTSEAVARWQESERAHDGSLETLESLVCEVYRDPSLEQQRAALRTRAQQGDTGAAVRLMALDGRYEHDWWNNGPNRAHLEHDLPLLQNLPPGPRINAARCAAECLLKPEPTAQEIRAILNRYGCLVDPQKTLPSDASLLSLMLGVAIDSDALTRKQARQQFGDALRLRASSSSDPSLFNVLAYLFLDTEPLADIEKQAWEATHDPRFAAGYLTERLKRKSLDQKDPILSQALQQCPEDSWITLTAIAVSTSPDEKLLVQAIKAEYRHFSSAPDLVLRPSARPLRRYFVELARVLNNKTGSKAQPDTAAPPIRHAANPSPAATGPGSHY